MSEETVIYVRVWGLFELPPGSYRVFDIESREECLFTRLILRFGPVVAQHQIGTAVAGLMFEGGSAYIEHREFDDPDAQSLVTSAKGQLFQTLKRTVRNRNAAKQIRKNVTRTMLEEFREAYQKKCGHLRGWKTAACLEFNIDQKTLAKRIAE